MTKLYTKISFLLFALIQLFFLQRVGAQNCWAPLGSGISNGGIFVSTIYNGNLIVAGEFDTAGGVPAANIASWDGNAWSALGSGIKLRPAEWQVTGGAVLGLAVYNGELYASGEFDTAGGVPVNNIARWNGNSWSPVGSGIPSFVVLDPLDTSGTTINQMVVYNGELYVGGSFGSAGGVTAYDIARWNGTNWSAVGAGIGDTQDPVNTNAGCLTVINNILYAGGSFTSASGVPALNIATWDGNQWAALGPGVGNDAAGLGGVGAIVSYQGEIYVEVEGIDPNQNNDFSIEKWDGASWSNVVGGPGTGKYYDGYVFSLLPFNGNLVAAGYYPIIGNDSAANSLAQWDGTNWTNLDNGPDSSEYQTLINYNNHLYVEGYFDMVNHSFANGIAEYTCATSAGVNEIKAVSGVHVFPNPTNGIVSVSIDNLQGAATIQIYNLLGQQVLQSNLDAGKTEINLAGASVGTYLYRVTGANGGQLGGGSLEIQ